ncbi:hypothetical protein SB00610_03059 [Klebsiella quasipneumoniae subsp. similipneumoniae]|nr:hypothetical protein SB00610_03059 [Klebsiella quasipneumoniae subsp. similipneumoniae]
MMLSHAVRQAFVEPGIAKISVWLATPATARDCSVEVPISSNDSMRNTSPKPSTSRSNSGSSASGAWSPSVNPVPPVISTTCTSSLAIHTDTWARMA